MSDTNKRPEQELEDLARSTSSELLNEQIASDMEIRALKILVESAEMRRTVLDDKLRRLKSWLAAAQRREAELAGSGQKGTE